MPLTSSNLRELASVRDETTLVFFASWCSDCKRSLLQPRPAGSVAIATFDEKDAAEAVIAALGVQLPCYLDDGVAADFGVKSVPATKVVDRTGRVK